MSSDNNRAGDTSKQISPDIMKKLNEAFSSYLDGKQSTGTTDDLSEKDSLIELVQSGIIEKQSMQVQETKTNQEVEIADISKKDFIDHTDKKQDGPEDVDEPSGNNVTTIVPDVLSGVFDDVAYQSVEIEIEDMGDPAEIKADMRYSEAVSAILKKIPKNSDFFSVDPSNSNVHEFPLPAKDKIILNEQGTLPELKGTSSNDVVVDPSTAVMKTQEPVKSEPKKQFSGIDKFKTAHSSLVSSHKGATKETIPEKIDKPLQVRSTLSSSSSSAISDMGKQKVSTFIKENIPSSPVNIAFLYSKDHIKHDAASLSINTHEKPERLIKAMWYLEKSKVFNDGTCTLIDDFGMADEADLLRVHDGSYISFVRSYAYAGGGFLGDSTYMTPSSYDIAKMAAGAAIKAGDLLIEQKFSHAFVLARPPGHHASSQKYGGFCLFNNAAVLARHLQRRRNVGRVLIIDWDAHAGDGTMEIFYEDPTVMFISLHRDPHGFYPRKGFSTQIGENAGKGYTMNVEMPEGAGNDEYMLAFDEVVVPLVGHFAPEFIIFSCGFDAYYQEKNIGLTLDSEGYHQMTSKIRSVFHGPMVFLMEGGYHDFNGQLCHSVLSSLHGKPNPVSDRQGISSYKMNLQKQIFADTQKKIAESKKNSPILSLQVS
ncbi:histone deacetylase family protein [Methanolobus psychrotolerans]|uniref:histone deacetylase family protein n=1 Tax=Methanolobus psychrotolerans TaxID=1874706 RepID=UPI000B91C55D|nr:histone deacetylase [Methanolobus psychrotolerans]